jgi:hypothetical protein
MSSDEETTASASEETKRKFREALDRKNKKSAGNGEAHLDGQSAIQGTHASADHSKQFRRKSG